MREIAQTSAGLTAENSIVHAGLEEGTIIHAKPYYYSSEDIPAQYPHRHH